MVDDPDALLETFSAYTYAYNKCASWGYHNKSTNKVLNHHATYKQIREDMPEFPSALIQCARDCACEALKATKCKVIPKRKEFSAMRYNKQVITVNLIHGIATIASIAGRIKAQFSLPKVYEKYLTWTLKSSNLQYREQTKEFYLLVQVESLDPPMQDDVSILGIDRGIKNIAVCSDNTFFGASKVKNVRCKYKRLRAKLQSKGTKSAKRLLKRMSGKERRFQTDVNHCISKEIVSKPNTIFVLEDLSGIRPSKKEGSSKGKTMNFWLSSWSFFQLEQFIEYKAEDQGKVVLKVDPAYTSQECSNCGKINKNNRRGLRYKCSCGLELNADLNAARNIANRGMSVVSRVLSTTHT